MKTTPVKAPVTLDPKKVAALQAKQPSRRHRRAGRRPAHLPPLRYSGRAGRLRPPRPPGLSPLVPNRRRQPVDTRLELTFLGHQTWLAQGGGHRVLIDPVLERSACPAGPSAGCGRRAPSTPA